MCAADVLHDRAFVQHAFRALRLPRDAQARRYRDSLLARPDWRHAVETAVVEVYGNLGYRWFPVSKLGG